MVLRKTKPHRSVTNGGEIEGTRVEDFQGKCTETVDHWNFLNEIEAPMWADLTSETNFAYQDKEDEWFHITHPFHQCSSRQLISAFSHSAEGPSSVSRSRGKHYRSKEWGQSNTKLVGKSSWASSGSSSNETKPKPRNEKSKNGPGPKTGSLCESSLTATSRPNYPNVSSFGDSKPNSDSSILTSTSASVEVSSQIFSQSQSSGLLSALKISLRKSCVTRQASRVEKNGPRKSEGCKYSSGNSSVGSSSNPGFGSKSLTVKATQNKEESPDSRNATRISGAAPKKIVRGTNLSKVPVTKAPDVISSSRYGRVAVASKSLNQEMTKAKVQRNTVRARGLGAQRVNQQEDQLVATKKAMEEKVGIGRQNRFADAGKENNIKGKTAISVSQKYNAKEKPGVVEKSSKQSVPQKGDRKKTVGPKEKSNCQIEGKKHTNLVQKVYFR